MLCSKPYLNEVVEIIRGSVSDSKAVVFLEAGHFDPRRGATTFSRVTLEDSLELVKCLIKQFNRQVKVVLGILVDDLGLECGETSCSLQDMSSATLAEGTLPDELEKILISPYVKRDRVVISSERACKNRSLLSLKKALKSDAYQDQISLKEGDGVNTKVLFTDDEFNEILLAEFFQSVWKAKCPAIMGQHYVDCYTKMLQRDTESTKLMIIDWSEMLDHSKVTAGSQAALKVFSTAAIKSLDLDIVNIFFGDDLGQIYEIKHFNNSTLSV
jgi:hypothetical protein